MYDIYIHLIHGGDAANAIPRESKCIFFLDQNQLEDLKSYIIMIFDEIRTLFESIEPNMNLTLEKVEEFSKSEVFSKIFQDKLLDLLYTFPNGPITFHPKINNLMFTSTNLGKIRTKEDHIKIRWLHRSLSTYYNHDIYEKILALIDLSGLEKENKFRGSYPPWEANFNSKLLKIAKNSYKELFNEAPEIKIIHGGLEATLLINKIPGIDAIAIGANAKALHSPDERLEIKSVERTWKFLIKLLEELDKNN